MWTQLDHRTQLVSSLLIVVSVVITISWSTLGVERLFRRGSRPTRDSVLKWGIGLLLLWPLGVLAGAAVGAWTRPAPGVVSATALDGSVRSATALAQESPLATVPGKRETVGTVWTPPTWTGGQQPEQPSLSRSTGSAPAPPLAQAPFQMSLEDWSQLASGVMVFWAGGVGLSLVWFLWDLGMLRRVRRRMVPVADESVHELLATACRSVGLKKIPSLKQSSEMTSPCTCGVFQPEIVLPAQLLESTVDRDTLLGILTHEAAHVARRDVAWSLLVRFVRALYWWEPGLVQIDRRISRLREEICDNYVLLAPVDRRVYAKTLLDFAEGWVMRPMVGVIGMMGRSNPLAQRVERLLADETTPQTRMGRWGRWGTVCGGLLLLSGIGAAGVWADRWGVVDLALADEPVRDQPVIPQVAEAQKLENFSHAEGAAASAEAPAAAMSDVAQGSSDVLLAQNSAKGEPVFESAEAVQPAPDIEETFDSLETAPRPSQPVTDAAPTKMVPVTVQRAVRKIGPDGKPVTVFETYTEMRRVPPSGQSNRTVPGRLVPSFEGDANGRPVPTDNDGTDIRSVPEPFPEAGEIPRLPDDSPSSVTLQVPGGTTWTAGQTVALNLTMPDSQSILPKQIVIHGLRLASHGELDPTLSADPNLFDPNLPTPPSPPLAEPAATPPASSPQEVMLIGPSRLVGSVQWLISRGGVPELAESATAPSAASGTGLLPTVDEEFSPGSSYRLTFDVLVDEAGKLSGVRVFDRELPGVSEGDKLAAIQRFIEAWVAKGHEGQRPFPGQVSRSLTLNVPDSMRYGDAQSLAMACVMEGVGVQIHNTAEASGRPLKRTIAAVELTRVYDKQGKPVGPGAILVAHKHDAGDPQIITQEHWSRALGDFSRHHPQFVHTLVVNADPDLPIETLRDLQILANREGIYEVLFRGTAASPLTIEREDQLAPLLDDTQPPTDNAPGGYRTSGYQRPFDSDVGTYEMTLPSPFQDGAIREH